MDKDPRTVDNDELDDNSVPSVNRRAGNNKLITFLGFIFILGAAAALIITANSDKKPIKKKEEKKEQIANKLPPLVVPEIPQQVSAPVPQQPPPIPMANQNQLAPKPQINPNKKDKVIDWRDRKMGGTLVVESEKDSDNGDKPKAKDASEYKPKIESASGDDLGDSLKPTTTDMATASLLPDRNYLITKGTTLDCALETAIDTSLPGITTCRLTRDVYSDNNQVLLLDRGSTLVGEVKGGIRQGQVRIFVLWTRAKTPNGVVVSLNSPGTDTLGRSGLEGWVDNHFWERFGAAILISFIKDMSTAAVNSMRGNGGNNVGFFGGIGSSTGGEKVVEKILQQTANIPPTIIKNQGDHVQVMVSRDLDFSTVYNLEVAE